MSHATLRITRTEEGGGEACRFDVWNPLEGRHEPCATLDEAKRRLQAAASAVRELWVAHDPRLSTLPEAPLADTREEFAELRVTTQANRHYDVRSFDAPDWVLCPGYLDQALAYVCGEVGYPLEKAVPPTMASRRQSEGR